MIAVDASAQRIRIGAELRRLRERLGISGERVAREFDWSQSKISRIEAGRHSFTVKDVARLLDFYGVSDEVRVELLGATAHDTDELSWIVQAGGYPRRQEALSALESVTRQIRHYQPVVIPGLLQTYAYARLIAQAAGASDPDAIAERRMQRQKILTAPSGPRYQVVLDARALLLRPGPIEVLREQIAELPNRAKVPSTDIRVIPLGAEARVFATVGFYLYEFRNEDSPDVAWIESPTGDVYYSAPRDTRRYLELFRDLQGIALSANDSVEYLTSLAADVERYMGVQPKEEAGRE